MSLPNPVRQIGVHLLCWLCYIGLWVVAAPLGYRLLKNHDRSLRWIMGVCFLWISFLSFGFLGLWILAIPLICVELALEVSTKAPQKKLFKLPFLPFSFHEEFYQIVLLLLVILLHLLTYLLFFWFSEAQLFQIYEDWFQKMNIYFSNLSQKMGQNALGLKKFTEVWKKLIEYIPAVYFGSFILGFYSCFWNTRRMKTFQCPESLFWLTLFSFALGFLSWETLNFQNITFWGWSGKGLQFWGRNLFFILSCMYFFQGFSVFGHIMRSFKITRFWQNMWYILIIFNFPVGLVFIGLVDFIFEFRSRRWKK